jgi:hypothetical protein
MSDMAELIKFRCYWMLAGAKRGELVLASCYYNKVQPDRVFGAVGRVPVCLLTQSST